MKFYRQAAFNLLMDCMRKACKFPKINDITNYRVRGKKDSKL